MDDFRSVSAAAGGFRPFALAPVRQRGDWAEIDTFSDENVDIGPLAGALGSPVIVRCAGSAVTGPKSTFSPGGFRLLVQHR
jgi:hypothetical protein